MSDDPTAADAPEVMSEQDSVYDVIVGALLDHSGYPLITSEVDAILHALTDSGYRLVHDPDRVLPEGELQVAASGDGFSEPPGTVWTPVDIVIPAVGQ